ncbi:MAG: anti-sigma factor antagonist, partial [Methanocalculus sp. MSAO_Arc2]|uniref:STAS domain-containing protein n=1 Tax=Methanocalculus sp. MSAO_Arc2 TaxID=2293855 RepID=UPI000FF01D82
MMEFSLYEIEGRRVAIISGRIDSTNAPQVEEHIRSFAGDGEGAVILDCSGLEYISSAGLRALLVIEKELKPQNRHIILCSLRP